MKVTDQLDTYRGMLQLINDASRFVVGAGGVAVPATVVAPCFWMCLVLSC